MALAARWTRVPGESLGDDDGKPQPMTTSNGHDEGQPGPTAESLGPFISARSDLQSLLVDPDESESTASVEPAGPDLSRGTDEAGDPEAG